MLEPPAVKYKTNAWKEKYRESKKVNKALLRSLNGLQQRCARKDQQLQVQKKLLYNQARALKKTNGNLDLVRPRRHKYSVVLIFICVYFQTKLGLSYRQVQEVIQRFILLAHLQSTRPSASSIRNWVRKTAYHHLHSDRQAPLEDSILIVDETGPPGGVGMGQEKVLLILRLEPASLLKGQALDFGNVRAVLVKSSQSWSGEQINEAIGQALAERGGGVKYIISDRAPNIRKALSLGGYIHVNDCSHLMASYLERYYKNDVAFVELMLSVGKLRKKWVNSKNASLIAPQLRAKARFLNLFEIVDWMEKIGLVWHHLSGEQREELIFVQQHRLLIGELKEMTSLIKHVSKELKTQGLSQQSEQRVREIFKENASSRENITDFEGKMLAYLAEKRLALPQEEVIYCCSDVIESFFGKFKNRHKQGTARGISDDMIVMSLFSGQLSKPQVREAMEEVFLKNIAHWAKENTIPSFAKTKNEFWRNLVPKAA